MPTQNTLETESVSRTQPAVGDLHLAPLPSGQWLLSGNLFLHDRPGELADVSAVIAGRRANIEHFAYDRSQNANLVAIAARIATASVAGEIADQLRDAGHLEPAPKGEPASETARITDIAGLLKIKVGLQDCPGTLAGFAAVLKEHRANVIYMSYDGEKSPGMADIALATESAAEISQLLGDLNTRDYHYHVQWQGDGSASIDEALGLNVIERFLLSLKAALPREKLDALGELIRSSSELYQTLLSFKREAGGSDESMAASEVFTSILQLATSSVSKTGRAFALRLTGPVPLTPSISLYMLACPTGANAYLLKWRDQYVLIDSSYGLYYADAMQALREYGIDPARITAALFTHPDADHAGWAAPLQEQFDIPVYMHPDSPGVFEHENRAYGSGTRLMALNAYYTKLINRFTDLRAPRSIRPFAPASGNVGPFQIIGRFEIADLQLLVLQSLGGHVPAQVFFYAPAEGVLFCGDYLIDFGSLSERTKSGLSIPKYLMTSTNSDGRMFGLEMLDLAKLMLEAESRLQKLGRAALVFPGHGDFYRVGDADEMLRGMLAVKSADRRR